MFFLYLADFNFRKILIFGFYMLQILKIFLIFSLFPSISFAWNSSCYSPVQLAAYMSKPKKKSSGVSQSSVSKVKAKIRKLEKALDKVEGDLQDSLDKDKLKDKPSSVAGDIRNYIENKQDGWDCAEGGQSSLFFFPSLIPQAYAEITNGGKVNNSDSNSNGAVVSSSPECGSDKEYLDNDGNCVCNEGLMDVDGKCLTPEEECKQREEGWEWTGNTCKKTQERKCHDKGRDWILEGGNCVCKDGLKIKGNQCVDPVEIAEQAEESEPAVERIRRSTQEMVIGRCEKQSGMKWVKGEGCKKTLKRECDDRGIYWKWNGSNCECPAPYKEDDDECRDKTPQENCDEKPGKWKRINGRCLCPAPYKEDGNNCRDKNEEENSADCENQGKKWKNGECVDKPPPVRSGTPANAYEESVAAPCTASDGTWKDGGCVCKGNLKTEGNKCVGKSDQEKCDEKPGNWMWNRTTCICPRGSKRDGEICASKTKEDHCKEKGEGWTWKNGKCVECPKWKKHSAFKSNGRVSSGFCDDYAKDKGDCKSALSDLREYAADLRDLQNHLDDLKDALREKSRHGYEDESDTEADGVCIDCLKRIIRSSQPSTGQVIGQSLGLLMGAGISVAGYRAGQNAQKHANMMRVQQGYPGMYDGFSLTGAGAGFPFMANSLYGMTRASTPAGGWACSPTVSPYGHTFNAGYGYGHNMRYY